MRSVLQAGEGAVDDRRNPAFGVVRQEGLFEDAFAGAGFTEHQTEAALLGMDAEDVEDFLLVRQQRDGFRVEGIALQAEVGADHISVAGWGLIVGAAKGFLSLAMASSKRASPMRSPL